MPSKCSSYNKNTKLHIRHTSTRVPTYNRLLLKLPTSKAFPVNDERSCLLVVLLGYPHLLERGGAIILIFMEAGARAAISFWILSATPGNIVLPPERTMFAYKSLRMSMSDCMIDRFKFAALIPMLPFVQHRRPLHSGSGRFDRSIHIEFFRVKVHILPPFSVVFRANFARKTVKMGKIACGSVQ